MLLRKNILMLAGAPLLAITLLQAAEGASFPPFPEIPNASARLRMRVRPIGAAVPGRGVLVKRRLTYNLDETYLHQHISAGDEASALEHLDDARRDVVSCCHNVLVDRILFEPPLFRALQSNMYLLADKIIHDKQFDVAHRNNQGNTAFDYLCAEIDALKNEENSIEKIHRLAPLAASLYYKHIARSDIVPTPEHDARWSSWKM